MGKNAVKETELTICMNPIHITWRQKVSLQEKMNYVVAIYTEI